VTAHIHSSLAWPLLLTELLTLLSWLLRLNLLAGLAADWLALGLHPLGQAQGGAGQ
jgi:hypothetical protein